MLDSISSSVTSRVVNDDRSEARCGLGTEALAHLLSAGCLYDAIASNREEIK